MNAQTDIADGWAPHGIAPVRAFQVYGMRRSGNHAIIDWLMRNAPEEASGGVFYNNCRPYSNPLRSFATLDCYDADAKIIPPVYREIEERLPEVGQTPFAVVSFEDFVLKAHERPGHACNDFRSRHFAHAIIIYRSFLNWSASLLAKLRRNPEMGALERMRVLTGALPLYIKTLNRAQSDGYVGICYDDWMGSETYRSDMLQTLGLPNRDNSKGTLQRFGGGSSFQKKVETIDELTTLSRDAEMAEDPEYQMLLWTAAHDEAFMDGLVPVFKNDAKRVLQMAESGSIVMHLPQAKKVRQNDI